MLMGYQIGCLCGRQQCYSEGVLWLILFNVNNAVDVYIFSLRVFYFLQYYGRPVRINKYRVRKSYR